MSLSASESRFAPPLRVAHVVRPAQGGMVSQVRSLLAEQGHADDIERFLAAPEEVVRQLAGAWEADVVRQQETTPLYVVAPPPVNPPDLLRHGDLVGRWAKAKGATLLHGHGLLWSPLFAAAARRAGNLPLVVTLHNLVPPPASLSLLQKVAMRLALGRATQLIAVSEAVAASARVALKDSSVLDGLRVVRNGVDLAAFENAPDKDEARRELALPPNAPVVVCLARLAKEKGLTDLIDAAARLTTPNARVLIAGEGPERATLEAQIAVTGSNERVQLLGRRDDVPRLLRAADVVAVPSREEGLGLAAVEGMAAGVPVVATRAGGLPEVVADGETGVLVPVGDVAAMAAALDELLAAPEKARAVGTAGRKRAHAHFTAARMGAQTRAVYSEALAEG